MLLGILRIHGHSMEPTIKDGQVVLISEIPYVISNPQLRDIVAFKNKGKIFIKRISEIKSDTYYLTGDNKNDSLDSRSFGFVKRGQILGKVL